MNKRVALLQPKVPDRNYTPNLGILYLAAVLEADGWEAAVFDENLRGDYLRQAAAFGPFLAGFTAVTPSIKRALVGAAYLKGAIPGVAIVFGGPHTTLLPDEVVSSPAVDYCLVGEGEYPLRDLARALTRGGGIAEIPNLVYKRGGAIVKNSIRPLLSSAELDRLPFPAFHLLDVERVFSSVAHGLYSRGKRILPIMTSRGCPFTCAFCCRIMGSEIRKRSLNNVLGEIGHLVADFGVDEIYFEDDNFTVDRARALTILVGIKERFPGLHLKFANGLRADRVDAELLGAIKAAGGYWIGFGIESGSERVLKLMKKNLDLGTARTSVALAKSLGFRAGANLILGYPGETWTDILRSIRYFRGLDLDSLAIVPLVPFPETEVHRLCREKGYLTAAAGDYDNYYFDIRAIKPLVRTPRLSPAGLRFAIWASYFTFYVLSGRRFARLLRMVFNRLLLPFRLQRR